MALHSSLCGFELRSVFLQRHFQYFTHLQCRIAFAFRNHVGISQLAPALVHAA